MTTAPTPGGHVTVQHLDTGEVVSWADGQYSGDRALRDSTRATAEAFDGSSLALASGVVPVDASTAQGVAAAALYACAGRGIIRTASFDEAVAAPVIEEDTDPETETAQSEVVY